MPRPRTIAYKVFQLLREARVASASDIARVLGVKRSSVYKALRVLMDKGYVEKIDDVYVLKKDVWYG